MCYCHQRNIKSSNTYGVIKIADFGLAREFTSTVVKLWYKGLELLLGYTLVIDMWSIGCIFAEMATKTALFPGKSQTNQLREIFSRLKTPTEEIWKGVSELSFFSIIVFPRYEHDQLDDLLSLYVDPIGIAVIRYDATKRISAKKLRKHPYYSDLDRSKLAVRRISLRRSNMRNSVIARRMCGPINTPINL